MDDMDDNDDNADNDDMVAPISKNEKVFITIFLGTVFSSPGQLNVSVCRSLQANEQSESFEQQRMIPKPFLLNRQH